MKEVIKLNSDKIYVELARIIAIANSAVKKAKEDNKKMGIPDTFWKNGNVYYVLPNGEITTNPPEIMTKN